MSLQARRFEQSVVVPIEDIERLLAAPPRRPVPRAVPVRAVPVQAVPVQAVPAQAVSARAVAEPVTPSRESRRAPVPVLTARRRPWVAVGAGALLLVGTAVGALVWMGGDEPSPPPAAKDDPRLSAALQDAADAREEADRLAGELDALRLEVETLRAAQPAVAEPARTARATPRAKAKRKPRPRARPRRVARARRAEAPRSRAVTRAPAPRPAVAANRAPAKKARKQAPTTAGDKGLEALLDGL